MKLQPIIRVKLSKYKENYELKDIPDGSAFERFANQVMLTTHQPDAFNVDNLLLDTICVGGTNDMGLDGVCIKLNGMLIDTLQDAEDIVKKNKRADIEFIFIQSKYKDKFDSGEYAKFTNGVVDFLGEEHFQPHNLNIGRWLDIKNYLLSDDVMMCWSHNPDVRLYYVVMGTWENSQHITAISQKCEKDIQELNLYGDISIQYVDSAAFKKILDENENVFSVVLNVMDTFSLTAVKDVENSIIILCSVTEFLRLLVSDEGIIRRNLFEDNVRDYQGDTNINQDIFDTIENNPFSFVLLNNGITIICDEICVGNRKVTIKNPQIVNGCQTCNAIYHSYKKNIDLKNVTIIAKLIATKSSEITNLIVKGTNRQNIVYDEAFETTRLFHKNLEDLFNALSTENKLRLFYERRSKQYSNNSTIKPFEKINLRGVIQSFVSVFLNEPYKGHRHESKLLQEYNNKIFNDSQSQYPYYIAALLYSKIDKEYRDGFIHRDLYPYKMHLCWMVKEFLEPNSPSINNEKEIDNYCDRIRTKILNQENWNITVKKAGACFERIQNLWVCEKGDSYKHGIKDSMEYFRFLQEQMHISTTMPLQYRGTVLKCGLDRNRMCYGFISRMPHNIFFHEKDNPSLFFPTLCGRDVLYNIGSNKTMNKEKAINVQLI